MFHGIFFDLYFHLRKFDLFQQTEKELIALGLEYEDRNATSKIEQIKQNYEIQKKEQIIANQQLQLEIADNRFRGLIIVIFLFVGFAIYFFISRNRQYRTLKALYEANKAMVDSSLAVFENNISDKDEKLKELYDRLLELLNTQQVYKNSQLDLSTLSKILKSNDSYLSEAINKIGSLNLNQLLNRYQVKAILKEIHQSDIETLSFKDLCFQNGFNSRSTFYRAFKNEVGMSPQQYLKFMQEQNS